MTDQHSGNMPEATLREYGSRQKLFGRYPQRKPTRPGVAHPSPVLANKKGEKIVSVGGAETNMRDEILAMCIRYMHHDMDENDIKHR